MTYSICSVHLGRPVLRWNGPALTRVLAQAEENERGCWIFTGHLDRFGYGSARNPTGSTLAHRVVYEGLVGPIPDGLVIDHLCRVPSCVNPDHLEPVTQAENVHRGIRQSPYCVRGHLVETLGRTKHGECRACVPVRSTERRRKNGIKPRENPEGAP